MHNALNRIQNVFGYFTTVTAVVALLIAVTSLLSTPVPKLDDKALTLRNVLVVKGRAHSYSTKKEEFAHIKFDLDVDLASLFTWNTKQIFLYITATYPPTTSNSAATQAIIWDAILPHPIAPKHHNTYSYPSVKRSSSKSKTNSKTKTKTAKQPPPAPGILKLDSQRPKYQITDVSGSIAQRTNATLELNWNIQPWVGALQWVQAPSRVLRTTGSIGAGSAGRALLGTKSRLSWLRTWRAIGGSSAGRTAPFDFPSVKDRAEAAKAAGKEGLVTERGGEGNRGRPA